MGDDYKGLRQQMMDQLQQASQLQANYPNTVGVATMGSPNSAVYYPSPYISPNTIDLLSERLTDMDRRIAVMQREIHERDRYIAELIKHIPDALTLAEFRNYEAVAKRFREVQNAAAADAADAAIPNYVKAR